MTPLVKAMLRSTSRVSDEARLKELNKRISEVISENRKQFLRKRNKEISSVSFPD